MSEKYIFKFTKNLIKGKLTAFALQCYPVIQLF